jgi:hypothetical protein
LARGGCATKCCGSVQFTLAQSKLKVVLRELFHKFFKPFLCAWWHFTRPFQTKTLIPWHRGPEHSFGQVFAEKNAANGRQVMKKILKKHHTSNLYDFAMRGRHIDFLRIRAFASEGINFTEEETVHFDVCRVCRLNVIDALRNLADEVPAVCGTTMRKAA